MAKTKRALLSVFDKTGLEPLARGLIEHGYELVASGGTATRLSEAGLAVTPVDKLTGYPALLGGRVKTLHPAVFGPILARRSDAHLQELAEHDLAPIDVVVCNLYPFTDTVARSGVSEADAIEQIDIGGVTLLRAAAKNFEAVSVICDPADYEQALAELGSGALDLDRRRRLALKAFRHTAAYDAAIASWLGPKVDAADELPAALRLAADRVQALRYGENPHQSAALFRWTAAAPPFEQLQGKELSYNNFVDLDAAWQMPLEFEQPAVAIIKHTNPCGLACAETPVEAFRLALESDPVSAFGSIIACNREVDGAFAEAIGKLFIEVLIAPGFTDEALTWLRKKKKNCRVVKAAAGAQPALGLRSVRGGLLCQAPDERGVDESTWRVVTERAPTEAERRGLAFAWLVVKHVKSNAIVFVRGTATVGVGAGQMNRVDSVFLAARRAGDRAKGAVMSSDAFFPFPDGLETAVEAGVTAVIQPGGSIRDEDVIAAANRLGVAMVMTGERHFRH